MLLLNKYLVWMVMDIILDDIIDVMCRVNIIVVVEKLEFYELLFLNIVLDYMEILCNFIIKINILRICVKNVKLDRLVIKIMD